VVELPDGMPVSSVWELVMPGICTARVFVSAMPDGQG
jgi:hypothetical protein